MPTSLDVIVFIGFTHFGRHHPIAYVSVSLSVQIRDKGYDLVVLIFVFFLKLTFYQDGQMMGCRLVLSLALPSLAEVLNSCQEEETLVLFTGVNCNTIRCLASLTPSPTDLLVPLTMTLSHQIQDQLPFAERKRCRS